MSEETPSPGSATPAHPSPPTISISLVRELTRSETEERGSVLRSDSSCGGCPGTGAVFTALPPAGNLGKEKQRLRGRGGREAKARRRGAPRGTLSRRMLRLRAAGRDAGMQGCPGLCHRRLRAHQSPRSAGPWPVRVTGSAPVAIKAGLGRVARAPGSVAASPTPPVSALPAAAAPMAMPGTATRPGGYHGDARHGHPARWLPPRPQQHRRLWQHLTGRRVLSRPTGASTPRCPVPTVPPLPSSHRRPSMLPATLRCPGCPRTPRSRWGAVPAAPGGTAGTVPGEGEARELRRAQGRAAMAAGGHTPGPRCHEGQWGHRNVAAGTGQPLWGGGAPAVRTHPRGKGTRTQTGTPRCAPARAEGNGDKPPDGRTGHPDTHTDARPSRDACHGTPADTPSTRRHAAGGGGRTFFGVGRGGGAMGTEAHAAARGGRPLAHPHTHTPPHFPPR